MIKMIHNITGVEMWVHESNVQSFLDRGHKLAPIPEAQKAPTKKRPVKKQIKK